MIGLDFRFSAACAWSTSASSRSGPSDPADVDRLFSDRFKEAGLGMAGAPRSPMLDETDASELHEHDTGKTCVHRIDVGPSFSQKCAKETCMPRGMLAIASVYKKNRVRRQNPRA